MVIIDVYIWLAKTSPVSVGHVMVTARCSRSVYLSQYPHQPGVGSRTAGGPNNFYTFEQTYAAQARPAAAIFMVTVPDEAKFRQVVNNHRRRTRWAAFPWGADQTHCARAAADALTAGGLATLAALDDGGQILPDELYAYLRKVALLQKNSEAIRPWRVSMRAGEACAR
jgi:hypothetical protein